MSICKGHIYIITCCVNPKIYYIGSTYDKLKQRWTNHKTHYKNNSQKISIFEYFDKYGLEKFSIHLIKSYDVYRVNHNDHKHLKAYEQLWINKLKGCCNKISAFQPLKKEQLKKSSKKYREKNKEQIKEQKKEYRENNKEQIKQYWKQYNEKNKEEIKQKNKEYNEKNKEKIKERKKEYRENNKEQIKERKKQYYEKNKEEIKQKNKEYQKEYREKQKLLNN